MTEISWEPPGIPSGAGWLYFAGPSNPAGPDAPPAAVHFTRDDRGRWRADGLWVAAPALDSDMLRRLSIPAYEAAANTPAAVARLEQSAQDLDERFERTRKRTRTWLDGQMLKASGRRPSARLKVPPGAKPDSFYAKVAAVYRQLAASSNRPAVELAEANDVPVTTAHRWVKEARRRGHLPPGQKGRRG